MNEQCTNVHVQSKRLEYVQQLYSIATILSPNSWKSRQKSSEVSSLLFTATSTALPWDFCFYKLTQPLTVSTVQLLYTVKVERRKTWYPLLYGLRNPHRNLRTEISQDYAQKPQRKCTFMNSDFLLHAVATYSRTSIDILNRFEKVALRIIKIWNIERPLSLYICIY